MAERGDSGFTVRCTSCLRHPTHSTPCPRGTTQAASSICGPPPLPPPSPPIDSARSSLPSSTLISHSNSSFSSSHLAWASTRFCSASAKRATHLSSFSFSSLAFSAAASLELPLSSDCRNSTSSSAFRLSSCSASSSDRICPRLSSNLWHSDVLSSSFFCVSSRSSWQISSSVSFASSGVRPTQARNQLLSADGNALDCSDLWSSRCAAALSLPSSRSTFASRARRRTNSTPSCCCNSLTSRCRRISSSSNSRLNLNFTATGRQSRTTCASNSSRCPLRR
mmetsp:Transcript_99426/g.259214  ORF Transcript_99426/g.259214 Transcript_99426/m.259214 type:complete len:280 (-) Transcript_99426:732-1571(-)